MEKRNRKKCAGFIAMIFLIMSLGACGRKTSLMEAEFNDETRGYEVTAENAEETVCTGSITVSDEECIAVSSDLEKGCIIVFAFPAEDFEGVSEDGFAEVLSEMSEDDKEGAALRETISGNNVKVYPLAPGDYYIAFTTEKESTSGTLKAMPFSIEELKEQNKQLADTLGKEDPAAAEDTPSDTAGTAVSSDAAGKDASSDKAGADVTSDTAGKDASSDNAGKDASSDAAGKDASSDNAGKDLSSDNAGKDASSDAADQNSASGAADTAAPSDTDETAVASGDPGSEIAVAVDDSAKGVEKTGGEEGQNPVMGFIGPYAYGSAGMYIEAGGGHDARVSVAWGNSHTNSAYSASVFTYQTAADPSITLSGCTFDTDGEVPFTNPGYYSRTDCLFNGSNDWQTDFDTVGFVDRSANDYRLAPGSTYLTGGSLTGTDILGHTRTGSIGAYDGSWIVAPATVSARISWEKGCRSGILP